MVLHTGSLSLHVNLVVGFLLDPVLAHSLCLNPTVWLTFQGVSRMDLQSEFARLKAKQEVSENVVFLTALRYCLLVICAPIITFFGVKWYICEGLLDLDSVVGNIYSAGATLVVVHVVLGLFIYRAYCIGADKVGKQE